MFEECCLNLISLNSYNLNVSIFTIFSATSTKEAGMESRNLNESTTVKTKNSTKFVTSNKKKLQQSGKPIPKLMGKNRHQQLSKMLSKEKTENKPASLTMFLSSL